MEPEVARVAAWSIAWEGCIGLRWQKYRGEERTKPTFP